MATPGAGYGGQTLALDVQPFDLANPLEQAAKIQQERNEAGANLPGAQAAHEQAETATEGAQFPAVVAKAGQDVAESQLARASANNAQIGDAWSKIDPDSPTATDDMHASMQALVDQGVTQAGQFLRVPYTRQRATTVAGVYGAKNPQEGALAGATSGGLYSDDASEPLQAQWDVQWANAPPQKIQSTLGNLDAMKAALIRVSHSPDPSKAWDDEAKSLGHPDWVGAYSATRWQSTWDQVAPLDKYLRGRLTQTQAGAPGPLPPMNVKVAGNALYGVRMTPQGPEAQPLTPTGTFTLVGTDNQGRGVYHNTVTGEERVGQVPLGQKPGTTGAGSGGAYMIRYNAYLSVHPGDDQGALEYARTGAGGGAGKQMGQAQIQLAATNQARADWNALANSGEPTPPEGEEAWVQEHAQTYASQLIAAQNSGVGGGEGSGPPPPSAPAARPSGFISPGDYPADPAAGPRANARNIWVHQSQLGTHGDPSKVERYAATELPPMENPGRSPPANVTATWVPGQLYVTRSNGAWTIRAGQPIRVW